MNKKRDEEYDNEVIKLYKVELFIWDSDEDLHVEEGRESLMIHIDRELNKYFGIISQLGDVESINVIRKDVNKRDLCLKEFWEENESRKEV